MLRLDDSLTRDDKQPGKKICLLKSVSAVRVSGEGDRSEKLGVLAQLGAGTNVEPCGQGFNERTVAVLVDNQRYFVFLQDLESQETDAGSQH